MLNYELVEHSYKITTTHGGKLIGYFVPDIDGFYYFRPEDEKGFMDCAQLMRDKIQGGG